MSNVESNRQTLAGGPKFRTDLDPSDNAHVQVVKLMLGTQDVFLDTVCVNNPLPVRVASTLSEDSKFGYVGDVDTGNSFPIDVWVVGGGPASEYGGTRVERKTFPSSGAVGYVCSDSASDTCDVTLEYLDSNGDFATTEVTLTGTTPVNTGIVMNDCNRAYVSGDDQSNAGNIYISHDANHTGGVPDDTTQLLAAITATQGQTEQCLYTVPTGKIMRVNRVIITLSRLNGAAGSAIIELQAKQVGGSWLVKRHWNLATGSGFRIDGAGLNFSAGSHVRLRIVSVSDNNTAVSGELHYDLLDA